MKIYRAVGNYCAVNLRDFYLPVSVEETIGILEEKGFLAFNVDFLSMAREQIGKSSYSAGALLSQAPEIVDCSSFTKWVYSQIGIWIPRRSIQQLEFGDQVDLSNLRPGDLLFRKGRLNYYLTDPNEGVGHVGLVTEKNTVIHAVNQGRGLVEDSLELYQETASLCGACRIMDKGIITLQVSPGIETSDDIKWTILKDRRFKP